MEDLTGSVLNQSIGLGTRFDSHLNKAEKVTNFYNSYYRQMRLSFEMYPIAKVYGLSIDQAMAMPVDQWYEIQEAGERLAKKQGPDTETQLLDVLKSLVQPKEGGGE
jgi:hypothetical protein